MLEQFKTFNFKPRSLALIETATEIIDEYREQGFLLTLRQLYYQFVARDIIENTERSYKNLGTLINNARLAGMIDWSAIEDRTRNLAANSHWDSPADIIETAAEQFRFSLWDDQETVPEVWIEKEALVGIIDGVCADLDVAYFACRGYVSQSEQWRAYTRIHQRFLDRGQRTVILHLGDHDPSGLDMTRDNGDRLEMFLSSNSGLYTEEVFEVDRIALNKDQIEEYNPPPNPAKMSDSRASDYVLFHGEHSWELDALKPNVLAALIETEIRALMNPDKWDAAVLRQDEAKAELTAFAEQYRIDNE